MSSSLGENFREFMENPIHDCDVSRPPDLAFLIDRWFLMQEKKFTDLDVWCHNIYHLWDMTHDLLSLDDSKLPIGAIEALLQVKELTIAIRFFVSSALYYSWRINDINWLTSFYGEVHDVTKFFLERSKIDTTFLRELSIHHNTLFELCSKLRGIPNGIG